MLLKTKYLMLVTQSKKTDYNTKISETENRIANHDHDKYITTPEFNEFTAKKFIARLKQTIKKCQSNINKSINKRFDK